MTVTIGAGIKSFWKAVGERAAKTFAQSMGALILAAQTDLAEQLGVEDLDWSGMASVSAVAAILSLLTSLGSDAVTKAPGPSLTRSETTTASKE